MQTATLARPPRNSAPVQTDEQPATPPAATPAAAPIAAAPRIADVQAAPPEPPVARTPPSNLMLILDTTAISEDREHVVIVNGVETKVIFKPREPKALKPAVAVKFLAIDSFKLTDADGVILPWSAVPKQPHQLDAGEQFALDDDKTIARLDELHNQALKIRVLQLPGGERFAESRDREAMMDFIIDEAKARRKKNIGRETQIDGLEEFTPPPESDATFFGDDY